MKDRAKPSTMVITKKLKGLLIKKDLYVSSRTPVTLEDLTDARDRLMEISENLGVVRIFWGHHSFTSPEDLENLQTVSDSEKYSNLFAQLRETD